jgi:hypothetical protein
MPLKNLTSIIVFPIFLASCSPKITHVMDQKMNTNLKDVYVKYFSCEDDTKAKFTLVNNSPNPIRTVELHIHDAVNDPIDRCVFGDKYYDKPIPPYSGEEIALWGCPCYKVTNISFRAF